MLMPGNDSMNMKTSGTCTFLEVAWETSAMASETRYGYMRTMSMASDSSPS